MKKISLLGVIAISIIFPSCKSGQNEPEPAVLDEVVIVKMDKNWQEGLIVSPIILSAKIEQTNSQTVLTYGDSLSLCNTQLSDLKYSDFAQNELDVLNFSPYIMLNNGYAIIHWRWRYFFSFASPLIYATDATVFSPIPSINNGEVTNNEFYYIATAYQHLKSLKQQWP